MAMVVKRYKPTATMREWAQAEAPTRQAFVTDVDTKAAATGLTPYGYMARVCQEQAQTVNRYYAMLYEMKHYYEQCLSVIALAQSA